jgi:uncharacterized repeat protein (TIGR01451 family)
MPAAAAAPAAPGISINNVTVAEGDTSTARAVFQLKLSRAVNQVVTVNYRTTAGSATSGTDYTPISGTAIFNRNQTTQTVSVFVRGDRTPEPNETFYVKLSDPRGASISDNSGTGTITGADPSADLVLSLTDSPDPATPGKNLTYTLGARNAGPNPATGVKLVDRLPGTVTFVSAAGCQYAAASRLVTCTRPTALAKGASFTKTIVVKPTKAGSLGNTASVEAVTFDPRPANNSDTEATAVPAQPSSPPPGTVSMGDVTKAEGNSGTTAFTFRATGACTDPDGQCFLRFTAPASAASGDTASSGTDYTAVASAEVAVGPTFDRTYTVDVLGDTAPEGDESFSVEAVLSTASGGTGATTTTTANGVITNDDQGPTGTLTMSDVTKTEGDAGTTDFTFHATGTCADPEGTCWVQFSTDPPGGTATSGSDYDAQTLIDRPVSGAYDQTFTVSVRGDTSVEPTETFVVHARLLDFQSVIGGNQLAADDGTGTITNDDDAAAAPTGSTISVENVWQAEGNAGVTRFTIHVTGTCADPTGTCTIGYGTARSGAGPGTDDTADSSDFNPVTGVTGATAGPYDITFGVDVYGDVTAEDTERFSTYVTVYDSTNFAVVAEDSGLARIVDDDGAVSLTSLEKKEGNSGTSLYTFHAIGTCGTVNAPCYLNVQINTSGGGGSATAGQDYASPAPLEAEVTGTYDRTFSVLVNGDTTPESDEEVGVTAGVTSAPSNQGENFGTAYGYGYILDDDSTDQPRVAVSYVVQEEGDSGTTPFVFHVTGYCGGCWLNIGTTGESATPHEDYVPPTSYSVQVNGSFDEIVPINVLGDEAFEGDETFRVYGSLSSHEGQGLFYGFANSRGTILNDEEAPPTEVFVTNSVVQDEGDSGTTTYTFHVTGTCGDFDAQCYLHFITFADEPGDTATRDVDYVNVPYNEVPVGPAFSRDYTVTVNGDTTPEPDEVFTVYGNLSTGAGSNGSQYYGSNTGTITNDDD